MSGSLTVDDLTFQVRRSQRRKSLEITIDRDGGLIVAAPQGLDRRTIDRFLRERQEWVYRKLAEKGLFWKPRKPREFVAGEGFAYLGRSYRLKLVDHLDCPLKLSAGRFCLKRAEIRNGRAHFIRWYSEHGSTWLSRRVPRWADRLGVKPNGIRILDLGHRWGSCSRAGTINVHWTTMQLPASIVDYVLVHELAHLLEPRHGEAFWRLVERTLPDFRRRKEWLAEQGHAYAGV